MHLYVLWLGAHEHRRLRRQRHQSSLELGSEVVLSCRKGCWEPGKAWKPWKRCPCFVFQRKEVTKSGSTVDLREGQGHHRINLGRVGSLKGPQFTAAELSTKKGQPGLKDLVTARHPSRRPPAPHTSAPAPPYIPSICRTQE